MDHKVRRPTAHTTGEALLRICADTLCCWGGGGLLQADRPDELERIRKAGGFVIHKRVMGELAISRAIGDKDFKAADFKLVIADPEIVTDTVSEGDEFIVLACDGLYDVMTNEQIVQWFSDQIKIQAVRNAYHTRPLSPSPLTTFPVWRVLLYWCTESGRRFDLSDCRCRHREWWWCDCIRCDDRTARTTR